MDGNEHTGTYTVACSLEKLVPDSNERELLIDAVQRTHRAVLLGTQLVNLHLRVLLEANTVDENALACFFHDNSLEKVFYLVTRGGHILTEKNEFRNAMRVTMQQHMPDVIGASNHPLVVDRARLSQVLCYEARNLAAVAKNNVWMHIRKRLMRYARDVHRIEDPVVYAALDAQAKRAHRLKLARLGGALVSSPADDGVDGSVFSKLETEEDREWVRTQRAMLGLDTLFASDRSRSLEWHAKETPHRLLRAMWILSRDLEARGSKPFALYPMRRSFIPGHIRIDEKALRALLHKGKSKRQKEADAEQRARKKMKTETGEASSPKQRAKADPIKKAEDRVELFGSVFDLRAARVHRPHHFAFSFTTDGVSARLKCEKPSSNNSNNNKSKSRKSVSVRPAPTPTRMPTRGIYAIDQIKHLSRLDELQVVGVDPGVRELLVAVHEDEAAQSSLKGGKRRVAERYTNDHRNHDLLEDIRQDNIEMYLNIHPEIKEANDRIADTDSSKTTSLQRFALHCHARREESEVLLGWYAEDFPHRGQRWATFCRKKKMEARLVQRLAAMKRDNDRQLVFAYGAWATNTSAAEITKRGNPPAMRIGLMRLLAKELLLVVTPEHYTSKTCCRCGGPCGAWKEKEKQLLEEVKEKKKKKKKNKEKIKKLTTVRGLRVCQDVEHSCGPLNRDVNAAINIGHQFKRLWQSQPPLRPLDAQTRELVDLEY